MAEQDDMLPETPQDPESLVGQDFSQVPESKWAPALANAVSVLEALYRRQGFDDDRALRLACDSVLTLAEYQGARVMYWPRGDRLRIALRDAEIHSRWQRGGPGNSIEQLATDYDLSVIHLYRVINQQRKLHLQKSQGRLFEG